MAVIALTLSKTAGFHTFFLLQCDSVCAVNYPYKSSWGMQYIGISLFYLYSSDQ